VELFFLGVFFLLFGGMAAVFAGRNQDSAQLLGVGGAVAGCITGLAGSAGILLRGGTETFNAPWTAPFGSFALCIDPLSAFFLTILFTVSLAAAVYGAGYMRHHAGAGRPGFHWLFFNVLIASMGLILTARNGVLFLVAWEVMSLSSFALVMTDHTQAQTRKAGLYYIIAAHVGAALLMAMFVILGHGSASMDFDAFAGSPDRGMASVVFILAMVGFGSKAGFIPLHVWLPEAHPAAPSHVSALMSGVMIKMGIYGIIRVMGLIGPPETWWGIALVGVGVVSGAGGVINALGQKDLKRLLAYSSVENVGIIAVGLGLGTLGVCHKSPTVATLGYAGALFHLLNHALFKSLLFMGAGSALSAAGTKSLDQMGGLLKKMPMTGALFLFGSASICGLPPLNGFMSELLIYAAAFHCMTGSGGTWLFGAGAASAMSLALMGSLSAALFTKAAGTAFLGTPRSGGITTAHDPGASMLYPMWFLAALTLASALLAPLAVIVIGPLAPGLANLDSTSAPPAISYASSLLLHATLGGLAFLTLVGFAVLIRRGLLAEKPVAASVTWDCGYAAPSARMQYTATSFSQQATDYFHLAIGSQKSVVSPGGFFATGGSFSHKVSDVAEAKLYLPAFTTAEKVIVSLQGFGTKHMNVYIFYTVAALLGLLVWSFWAL
jgi:formate hydrogenlyase subunit 3/multisubunit Na+/H+ antiporter MnhD subunit